MFDLELSYSVLLIICLFCACAFEFVNGFHDTANAVATVIYTNSLKPTVAVVWSGFFNFLGVFFGGVAVAMGVVNLLPVESLVDQNLSHSISMILALLLSAIFWNLFTWYLGIPCSSSHTLFGSILGVGLAYSLLPDSIGAAVNWSKAKEIGYSLLLSPIFGFSMVIILMFLIRSLTKKTPYGDSLFKEPKKNTPPPLWIRSILIVTCTLVSFFHGSNDGQKGVGLVMLILIGIVPGYFALNNEVSPHTLHDPLVRIEHIVNSIDPNPLSEPDRNQLREAKQMTTQIQATILNKQTVTSLSKENRFLIRKDIILMDRHLNELKDKKEVRLSEEDKASLKTQLKSLRRITDYTPIEVIFMISISLGLGTMIGWKRIVKTLGEKIGKEHLNYAQGASAEIVAATTIGLSTGLGLPVSTTHVLSSGIAGSMVASKGIKNLQPDTIRNILIAWLLTLPVVMIMSGALFLLFRNIL